MENENKDIFPLSKTKFAKGTRRLAREKVLQIISAIEVSDISFEQIFNHIFFRKFNFGDFDQISEKLLTPDEIYELESDLPINWDKSEIEFAENLVHHAISIKDYVGELIGQFTEHWELERINKVEKILLQIAVAELLYCPEVPVKVSINEAIEVAKKYSTTKSGSFINGILDQITIKLKKEDRIHKEGRGLIEE
ncbi:MAG: transcription antitermination factor NusB [Ignavibacteriae bacterium]|nr:transcription antitermination factor NusB [Ignavibacteriota bacterium]